MVTWPHCVSRSQLIRVNDKKHQAPAGLLFPLALTMVVMQAPLMKALVGKSALHWVMITLVLATTTTTTQNNLIDAPSAGSPSRHHHVRGQRRKRALQEALRPQRSSNCVGAHPDADFGLAPSEKADDVARLAFGNVSGTPPWWISNNKVNAACQWIRKYNVDSFFIIKPNLSWHQMPQGRQILELFHSENSI